MGTSNRFRRIRCTLPPYLTTYITACLQTCILAYSQMCILFTLYVRCNCTYIHSYSSYTCTYFPCICTYCPTRARPVRTRYCTYIKACICIYMYRYICTVCTCITSRTYCTHIHRYAKHPQVRTVDAYIRTLIYLYTRIITCPCGLIRVCILQAVKVSFRGSTHIQACCGTDLVSQEPQGPCYPNGQTLSCRAALVRCRTFCWTQMPRS